MTDPLNCFEIDLGTYVCVAYHCQHGCWPTMEDIQNMIRDYEAAAPSAQKDEASGGN